MTRKFDWVRTGARSSNASFLRQLANFDCLVTTWDSPFLDQLAVVNAPRLRIIAHAEAK